jgi:hypothetical protein
MFNENTRQIDYLGSIFMKSQECSDNRFVEKWAQKRKGGTLKIIIMFGGLYFGGMYFVATMILDHLHGSISASLIVGKGVNLLIA